LARRSHAARSRACLGTSPRKARPPRGPSVGPVGERSVSPTLNRGVEEAEPGREILLDRQLALELRLQLELLGVVALLLVSHRDDRPERPALVAVDPVDRMLPTLEAERGREQPLPEAALLQLGADQVDRRDEILELRIANDQPLEAEVVGAALHLRA